MRDSRCQAAQEVLQQARRAADEACKLEIAFAEEVFTVCTENCTDEDALKAAEATYVRSVQAAKDKCALAVTTAAAAYKNECRDANAARDEITRPARAEYDAAIKPHAAAKLAKVSPAQQQYGQTFNELFAARESSKRAANEENARAHAAISEAFATNRRTRVQAWLSVFDEFCQATAQDGTEQEDK